MLKPKDGGCWFCFDDIKSKDNEVKLFSEEFYCNVHESCIKEHVKKGNMEARIMRDEFGIKQ